MNQPRTLLEWTAEHALELALMRMNTERWNRTGVIVLPKDVRVRGQKKMSNTVQRGRKGHG